MTFFCVCASLSLGNALEVLLNPTIELVVAGCHIKSIYCGMLQSNQEMVHCCGELEKTTLQNDTFSFFWFVVSSWGTHLLSFSIFPICFKCWTTLEWLTLSSSAIFSVVVRGSASMILSVGQCHLPMAGHYALHLQDSGSPLQNSLNHHWTVCFLAVLGPNVLLILWVVPTALSPILTSNKKITWICFLANIISIV